MKLSSFIFLIGILLFVTFVSCKKDGSSTYSPSTQLDLRRVSYGSDTAQNMDVFLPAGRDTANTKVVLFIHGGSWSSGDKNEFASAVPAIRSQLPDFALFNMNYRLATDSATSFPTQMLDVQSAIDFITGKTNDYKINANKICLVGASAGAQLALLQAYKNNSNGRIKAVVDLFGPTDLTDLYNNHPLPDVARPVLIHYMWATPTTDPVKYFQASPINFINAQTVPTQIFHGGVDIVVPIIQSDNLKAKLQQNNVKVEMTVYPGEGHGWTGPNLTDTYNKAVTFIKANDY